MLEPVVTMPGVSVEQILSGTLESSTDYLEDHDEWAVVLKSGAELVVDGHSVTLSNGEWILLPGGVPHRLLSTTPGTSWLVVHARGPAPRGPARITPDHFPTPGKVGPVQGGHRCDWAESSDAMRRYHDEEWGVPSHDDTHLFEMLILEGAQAGLSWSTILNKRENYRRAFDGFDPTLVARYDEPKVADLLDDAGIVRNRLKVRGTVSNAQAFLAVGEEHGSFARYLWSWVDETPIVNRPRSTADLPARTELSDRMGKELKRKGFTFVGSTIVYSYLQAVGVVDDHLTDCPFKSV